MGIENRNILMFSFNAVILLTAFTILFGQALTELVRHWTVDENYSHGFLILPIALYMIWQKKESLAKATIETNKFGFVVIILGMILFFLGNLAAELFIIRFSIVVTVYGLILFYLGRSISIIILVPTLYLLFMIPIPSILWNKIAFPLQLMSAKITTHLIQMIGIPILREGNILYLPNATLEVVGACSGLRSLTSLLALSAAFAYIVSLKTVSRWALFLSAFPIAIISNIARLTFTAFIARLIGQQQAQGFLHDISGMFVFVVAIILFYIVYQIIKKLDKYIHKKRRNVNHDTRDA